MGEKVQKTGGEHKPLLHSTGGGMWAIAKTKTKKNYEKGKKKEENNDKDRTKDEDKGKEKNQGKEKDKKNNDKGRREDKEKKDEVPLPAESIPKGLQLMPAREMALFATRERRRRRACLRIGVE